MAAANRRPAAAKAAADQQKKEQEAATTTTTKTGGPPPAAAAPAAAAGPRGPLHLFSQYGGLALCVLGVALLWAGYGKGWMHDTSLTLLCVALNLAGLFLHETRPFSLERIVTEQREALAEAKER